MFEHRTVQVKDIRIHYVRAGAGNPIVLLRGWPRTWTAIDRCGRWVVRKDPTSCPQVFSAFFEES